MTRLGGIEPQATGQKESKAVRPGVRSPEVSIPLNELTKNQYQLEQPLL